MPVFHFKRIHNKKNNETMFNMVEIKIKTHYPYYAELDL